VVSLNQDSREKLIEKLRDASLDYLTGKEFKEEKATSKARCREKYDYGVFKQKVGEVLAELLSTLDLQEKNRQYDEMLRKLLSPGEV